MRHFDGFPPTTSLTRYASACGSSGHVMTATRAVAFTWGSSILSAGCGLVVGSVFGGSEEMGAGATGLALIAADSCDQP